MINSLICTLDMLWMYATCDACVGCMHAVFDVWKGMPYVHVWRVEVHA